MNDFAHASIHAQVNTNTPNKCWVGPAQSKLQAPQEYRIFWSS